MITEQELLNAAEEMRISLYDWQKEIIFDTTTKQFCILAGRKSGKTQAVSLRIAWKLLNGEVKGNGISGGIGLTGIEMKSIKGIVADVKNVMTALGWRFVKERVYMNEEKKVAYATTTEIYLPNGCRLVAMACGHDGDSIRPFSFHELVYDESDFLNEDVFISTLPCLARFDGVEILLSTPNDRDDTETHTAKAFFGVSEGYKIYHRSSEDSPHIPKEYLERMRKSKSAREYDREFRALYGTAINMVFPLDLIQAAVQEIDWTQDTINFIGGKFGRFDKDLHVIVENHYNPATSRSHLRLHLVPATVMRINEIEEEIVRLAKEINAERVVMDTTSLGNIAVEGLAGMLGTDTVVGVSNHPTREELQGERNRYSYEDLYVRARKLLERGEIIFEDSAIAKALRDVKHDYERRQFKIIGNDITDAIVRALFPVWGRNEWYGEIPKKFAFFPDFPTKIY